ncbi:LysR substrate-binding domain-containing protein (plasmid) [Brevundimonas staleyi]|uniref:LysR substrate-binding domain-containing protein n=1 Tax=Brevundimonas staleyi TaxID=74326 RepID=A0ABW0FNU5_9CAUL
MQDLNDILFFTAVVEHNGFSAAARALNRPKSSISRHVDRLEARLGVRLLERSTRRVRLTEVGGEYYARCRAVLADLEGADRDVALHRSDPVGIVRVTCPPGIARQAMGRIIPGFLARYPEVRVQLKATNQVIDLIHDKIDVAIRARSQLRDESLTMRKLGISRLIFVASPCFVVAHPIPSDPAELGTLPFLSFMEETERPSWTMRGPEGVSRTIAFDPILWTSEFDVLVEAACAGTGIALLPAELVEHPIAEARLARVLPDWHSEDVTVHLVFPTARGLRPAVRVFIDYVVANFGPCAAGS